MSVDAQQLPELAQLQVCLAKHHSLAVCQGGELYSWGSNRDGRLGYLGPDSQPTPRRYDI